MEPYKCSSLRQFLCELCCFPAQLSKSRFSPFLSNKFNNAFLRVATTFQWRLQLVSYHETYVQYTHGCKSDKYNHFPCYSHPWYALYQVIFFCQQRHFNEMYLWLTATARNLEGTHFPPHNYLAVEEIYINFYNLQFTRSVCYIENVLRWMKLD